MPNGYTRGQIALHWLVGLLILVQFLLAEGMAAAWRVVEDGGAKVTTGGALLHVGIGAAVLVLALWRLMLRSRAGVPAAAAGESAAQQQIARITHAALYLLMILLPVSGGLAWFGEFEAAAAAHQLFKTALIALVGLHLLGALYNQFVLKNGLLQRMTRPRS